MAWWTLQHLVVTALVAGAVQIVCRAGRIGPVGRHALWVLVLLKLLTPPLVVLPWIPVQWAAGFGGPVSAPVHHEPVIRAVSASPAPASTGPRVLDEATGARSSRADVVPPTTIVRDNAIESAPTVSMTATISSWIPLLGWMWLAGALAF